MAGNGNGAAPHIPEEEANDIIQAVKDSKSRFESLIVTFVASKANAEAKKEVHKILKDLGQVDNLEQAAKDKIDTVFSAHPEYIKTIKFTVASMPEPGQAQVLDYASYFVTAANESDPAVAEALVNVMEWAQEKFELFPESFYTKLQATLGKSA
ncbi:hypothetical protein DSO57_1030124 [Entomophthora muscae]|uniref:Uncharacterized protein n=1 Tax=Entomophthora muscae TaxID=34485 RepID=A0ACC2ULL8_9FUNG|nr:hypothetical protein DSO57_1030124 [Entomophthora muscae]